MEILTPTPVSSFLNELQVVDHSANTTYTLQVASFDSILSIKQRITLRAAKTDGSYLPNALFVAVQLEEGIYTPIEFQYVDGFDRPNQFPDPLTHPPPDRRFVTEEGVEIPISKESYNGLTFKQIPFHGEPVLHIWTLRSVAALADPTNMQEFIGYFQVYFPLLTQPNQVEESLHTTMTRDQTEIFTKLQTVQASIQKALRTLEERSAFEYESIQLIHITRFHTRLPALESIKTEGLDILFHKMKGSRYVPFLRYFPQSGTPILKLATGPGGIFFITNVAILGEFLRDIPDVENGSILMIKLPIESQDIRIVQKGFAWTLLIYTDGTATLQLDAYRSNDPITYTLLETAFKLLPSLLTQIGWSSDVEPKLSYFSGVYEINLDSTYDVSQKELERRVKQYAPLLFEEANPYPKVNGVMIRSRIGTFPPQEDPFQRAMDLYIVNRVNKQFASLLTKEFGIPSKQIADVVKRFNARNTEMIELYGEPTPTPSEELGATLFIENQSPRFLFKFEFVQSMEELNQLITIANLIIEGDTKLEYFKKAAKAAMAPKLSISGTMDNDEENAFAALQTLDEPVTISARKETYNYIDYLMKADYNLFKFTSKLIKAYTTSCQRAQHRQPYVLSPNKYKDIQNKYRGLVHMIEYPLSDYNAEVVVFVTSTAQERRKYNKKTKKEKEAMELHGLRLGIPLDGNESFLGEDASPHMKAMIEEQQKKELWVIARAGSDPKKPNYYVCSKLWCATDQLPILQSEYDGDMMRNGAKKRLIPSCPFCGEQNVIERKENHIYVGYFNKTKHPKNYILPCCFKTPDNVILPKDAVPIPNPPKGMEPFYPDPDIILDESTKKEDRLKDLGIAFKKIQSSSAYILRSTTALTEGTIGITPTAIDTLLGQSVDSYTTTSKGNLKLEANPRAFIRFGVYGDSHVNGQNFLQFLSYLLFVTARIGQGVPGISSVSMMCPADTLRWITTTHMVKMARAFEAANYGTLIREFDNPEESVPGSVGSSYTALEFQTWMGKMELGSADRAHVVRFFKAWKQFVNYLSNPAEEKELRLWDGILSTPGLFSKDGILLLRVVPEYSNQKIIKGELKCPPFGVSKRTQEGSPCLVPIYYMEEQSIIEPLLYVETTNEYIGAIHPSTIGSYSKESRKKLLDLYSQFLQPILGCGRPVPPINAWYPDTTNLVRLGILLDFLQSKKEYTIGSILRERTNRVVGVLANGMYIPVSDDGTITTTIPSSYDLDAIPYPSYTDALVFFTNLSKQFPVVKPSKLSYIVNPMGTKVYTQLQLGEYVRIPIESFEEGTYAISLPTGEGKTIPFREEDTILLKKADEESMKLMEEVDINPEELLEEAYQYLRLSFSNWLIRDGHAVAKQIELLRAARSRLPLYELRKRGDLLLHSLIKKWITTEGMSEVPPLLRQDCIVLKEGECKGMCSWSDGRCKIHTPTYGTIEDPAIILTSRLVDELLRTNGPAYEVLQKREKRVQRLRAPTGIVKDIDTHIISFDGRGDHELYNRLGLSGRRETKYTKGYRYPEEISAEDLGRAISTESGLPAPWENAGWSRSGELSDIVRKLPQLRDAVLRTLLIDSKTTYAAFEKELQRIRPSHSTEPFTWSNEDIQYLSIILRVNIVITKKNERTGIIEFKTLLENNSPQYLLLDSESLPLLYKPSDSNPIHFVEFEQLPEDIQISIEVL